jgi:hypothetical protein
VQRAARDSLFACSRFQRRSGVGKDRVEQPEISVTLSAEQWLDLIAQMQQEFDSSEEWRKRLTTSTNET